MSTFHTILASLALAGLIAPAPTAVLAQSPPAKISVTDETQLPRFSYPMPTAPSKFLTADDATFAPFAAAVGADIDKTLATYDISDKATLSDYLSTKVALQVLAHDTAGARASIAALRADQTKAASQLLSDRTTLAYLDAYDAAKTDTTPLADLFESYDKKATDALPWDVVQDGIKATYAADQVITSDAIVGSVKQNLDPVAAKSGTLDGPLARGLVQARAALLTRVPFVAQDAEVLKNYIAANNVVKPDIWAARDVTIAPGEVKTPVLIGIWDSGVDPSDYPTKMYVDAAKRNGIAFNDDGSPSTSDLYPLASDIKADYAKDVALTQGESDLQAGIDSPAAAAARTYFRGLSVDQQAAFGHEMEYIGEYAHGSHVAGIATRGNAAAKIVVARFDDNISSLTFEPTTQWAERMAANFAKTGAYFRDHHVRVVNMSWGDQVSEFEAWLAKTDKNGDPTARKAKAQELFAIWRDAIAKVIASTPGTLFVAAAGNGDNDASFAADVPASLSYPNLIVVGAVNQAGDPASFTSYGPTVAVFADGYQVPSKIPGGYVVKFSGTSMASPNVANLAAKMFALDPKLTPVQARALIIKGATPSADGKRQLIDPKRTIALLPAASR